MKRRNFIKTAAIGAAGLSMSSLYALDPRTDRFTSGRYCIQPGAAVPVIADVEVFIAGGTIGGVAAARSASEAGGKVFLAGALPYFGEDVCGTFQNAFDLDNYGQNDLCRKLFSAREYFSPMHIKTILEKELIEHKVNFLYCSYVTEVIFGNDGLPSGVIINNRTGRQAIKCKSIIDCTPGAYVTRLAGVRFRKPDNNGNTGFKFIAIGNQRNGDGTVTSNGLKKSATVNGKNYPVVEYSANLHVEDFSFASLAKIEQDIRDRTWDIGQVDSADQLSWQAPYKIYGQRSFTAQIANFQDVPIEAFIPEGFDNVFVLSACADLPESLCQSISIPDNQATLGGRIGIASEQKAYARKTPGRYFTKPINGIELLSGVTGNISETLRPNLGEETIFTENTALPVLGRYDVIVAGGGTAGAPAAISASRNGAKTLLIEYLHGLGGTGTLGMIGRYWYGHRDGFTSEIDKKVRSMADPSHPRQKPREHEWVKDWKMEWYRREIRKAGGDIWFGVMATGAFVEDGKVKGVVIATPEGRAVVLAEQVVDSTGNADIAIAAGAAYEYTGKNTVAVQGSGLPKVDPDDHYNNTDWTFVDDADVFDVTRVFVSGKRKFPDAWDIGKLPQTRERRRIIADFMVSPIDMLNKRRYHDTISFHVSNFDTHGYTLHPYFIIKQPEGGHVSYDVDLPLRSLLPRGLEGIIVTGLGAGAHRDAMPVIRMQPCLQNQGYAVGCLVAKLVIERKSAREVDLKDIQKHLVDIGNLPKRVLTDRDNMPLPDSEFLEAINKIGNDFDKMEILFSDSDRGIKHLEKAIKSAEDHHKKVNMAIALGVLHRDSGLEYLVEAIDAYNEWDEGWHFTGMHQFGFSLSRLDTIIIAASRCRNRVMLEPLFRKAKMLTPDHHFSHFRAISVAFETLEYSEAAPVLYDLLTMPGVSGHHVVTWPDAVRATVPSTIDVTLRNNVLKELHLARALYRCGDYYSLGNQILNNYSNDLHGHYFRHAAGVLGIAPDFI